MSLSNANNNDANLSFSSRKYKRIILIKRLKMSEERQIEERKKETGEKNRFC